MKDRLVIEILKAMYPDDLAKIAFIEIALKCDMSITDFKDIAKSLSIEKKDVASKTMLKYLERLEQCNNV